MLYVLTVQLYPSSKGSTVQAEEHTTDTLNGYTRQVDTRDEYIRQADERTKTMRGASFLAKQSISSSLRSLNSVRVCLNGSVTSDAEKCVSIKNLLRSRCCKRC